MQDYQTALREYKEYGFSVLPHVFDSDEIMKMIDLIKVYTSTSSEKETQTNVFAIRQLLNKIPHLSTLVFNENVSSLLKHYYNSQYFLTKAIYFDKPPYSNWFVAYHQDLSISVSNKAAVDGYKNWTFKKNQYGVQPPLEILQNTITLRIHLDDTNEYNGALKIIPKSHLKGVLRTGDYDKELEFICKMKKGEVMIMSPLLLHASNKTVSNKRRRVIHLEFCNKHLTLPLQWLEKKQVS